MTTPKPIQWERLVTLLTAGGALSFLTVAGNLLVLVAILKYRRLRHLPRNFFIYVVSLAIADLVVGGFVQPLALINDLQSFGGWPFGESLCRVWRATDLLASTASILHLVFIGLERFRATSGRVLRLRGVSKRSALTNILIAWTLSAVISYPAIVWWQHHDSLKAQSRRTLNAYDSAVEVAIMVANNRTDVIVFGNETETKICQFTDEVGYILLSSAVSFYLPAIIIVVLYIRIFQRTTRLVRNMRNGTLFVKIPDSFGGGFSQTTAQVEESSKSTTNGVAENHITPISPGPVTVLTPFSPFSPFSRSHRCSIVPLRVHRGHFSTSQHDPPLASKPSYADIKRSTIQSPKRPASTTELAMVTASAGRCSSDSHSGSRLSASPPQLLLSKSPCVSGEMHSREVLHSNIVRLSSSMAAMSLKNEDCRTYSPVIRAVPPYSRSVHSVLHEERSSISVQLTRSVGNLASGHLYPFTCQRPSLQNGKRVFSNDRLHSPSISKSSLDIRCAEVEVVAEAQFRTARRGSNDSTSRCSVVPINSSGSVIRASAAAREALRISFSNGATPSHLVVPMTPASSFPFRRSTTIASQQQRRRANGLLSEQRAVKTLSIVVATFLICWTPFFICNVLSAMWPETIKIHDSLFIAFTYLGYLNSTLNPLIYAFTVDEYLLTFSNSVRAICCHAIGTARTRTMAS